MLLLPPLVLGTGVFALPWLVGLASRFMHDHGELARRCWPGSLRMRSTRTSIRGFSWRVPWGLRCCLGSSAAASRRVTPGRGTFLPDPCGAAALHAGASRWRAATLGGPSFLTRVAGRFVVVWVVAATNVTPALLFSAGVEGKTLGPAFLTLAGGDGRRVRWRRRSGSWPCWRASRHSRSQVPRVRCRARELSEAGQSGNNVWATRWQIHQTRPSTWSNGSEPGTAARSGSCSSGTAIGCGGWSSCEWTRGSRARRCLRRASGRLPRRGKAGR